MKIYIVGKINGLTEEEYIEKFEKVKKNLLLAGWDPITPCQLGLTTESPLSDILHKFKLLEVRAIFLLKDWEDSLEARLQKSLAKHEQCDIYFEQYHTIQYMEKLRQEVI